MIQNGRIVFANQAFCRMHGTTPVKAVGQPFLRFVTPEWRERLDGTYVDALAGKLTASTIEYIRLGCDPERGATEIRAKTVDLGQGPVTIGVCRDISERVAMERKVRENERLAYVGHLAASLSHEIRNPLSSINMNLQILSETLHLDGFDRRRLDITVREVSRVENILRQLLDLSRPVDIELGFVDVRELVQGCVDLVEPKTAEKRLKIVQRYARPLTPCKLDAKKLQQALLNLILNAIEVTGEGSRILVFAKTIRNGENKYLELGVRDSGPGVDPAGISRLFDPFYTTKAQGSGLGLSNVKRIVEAHKGNVEVRGPRRTGSDFCHEVAMESMNRVLVIDDDASIRESLEMYLQDKGLAVRTADTGNSGFRACLDYNPQVVILDIRLPDVSGLEILRRIVETCPDLKVIMITAYHDMESAIEAMRYGAYDYIQKPLSVRELDRSITKSLHISKASLSCPRLGE